MVRSIEESLAKLEFLEVKPPVFAELYATTFCRALRHDILHLPFEFSSPVIPLSPVQFLAGLAPRRIIGG